MDVPADLFNLYREAADDFISSNFGVNCRLRYPSRKIRCTNCITSSIGNKSSNRYRHGGPAPFSFGKCSLCGGDGHREEAGTTVDIKLRVYYNQKDWIDIGTPIRVPDGSIQVIGFIYDLPKIKQTDEILVDIDQGGYETRRYSLTGEPVLHGLQHNRYFAAMFARGG